MCTLAWGEKDRSLWICFNRDEQRARPVAEPPAIHRGGAHPLVYARDPQGGGTWFAASGAGFAVALLNHYPASGAATILSSRSRGRLVLDLAAADNSQQALALLQREELDAFAPFCLFLLAPTGAEARSWDGNRLQGLDYERPFWSTSSYKAEEVVAWRTGWWLAHTEGKSLDLAGASGLMRRTWAEDPAFGLTMDRVDARTLSQIELKFSDQGMDFSYRERQAEGPGYREPTRLYLPA